MQLCCLLTILSLFHYFKKKKKRYLEVLPDCSRYHFKKYYKEYNTYSFILECSRDSFLEAVFCSPTVFFSELLFLSCSADFGRKEMSASVTDVHWSEYVKAVSWQTLSSWEILIFSPVGVRKTSKKCTFLSFQSLIIYD